MKRNSQRKNGRARPMGPTLTDSEVDAALQLIQLSGDSGDSTKATGGGNASDLAKEEEEEESFGNNNSTINGGSTTADDQISSTMNNDDVDVADNLNDEAFLPSKRKFRSISDLYLKTKPLLRRKGKDGRKIKRK